MNRGGARCVFERAPCETLVVGEERAAQRLEALRERTARRRRIPNVVHARAGAGEGTADHGGTPEREITAPFEHEPLDIGPDVRRPRLELVAGLAQRAGAGTPGPGGVVGGHLVDDVERVAIVPPIGERPADLETACDEDVWLVREA